MRSKVDALRSLKRYLAVDVLPEEYEVRIVGEEGAYARPYCVVDFADRMQLRRSPALHADVECGAMIAVHPVQVPGGLLANRLAAVEAEEVLFDAFRVGLHGGPVGRPWTKRGHPMRVPLWDFDGVGLRESIEDAEARDGRPRRSDSDFMRLAWNASIGVLKDPMEQQSWTATAAITMSWSRIAQVASSSEMVAGIQTRTTEANG